MVEKTKLTKIAETPLKWCSVALSEIMELGTRLDASVYDIVAKQAYNTIMSGKYGVSYFGGEKGIIGVAFYPGRFKRIYVEAPNGEEFYLPSQMNDIYPVAEKNISKLTKCSIDKLRLHKNTVLLTRSGTVGTIGYVSSTLENKIFSDDVIRITFKNLMDTGYAYTYLKTKTGNKLLCTSSYGSVITHLEPEHLYTLPIPNAPVEIKRKINALIQESYRLRDKSNELLDEATKLLINELHLPPIRDFDEKTKVNAFSVKLSELDYRADASYHLPSVNKLINHLKRYAKEVTTVGDERISKAVILPGRFKRVYVEEGHGRVFIGGKQLYELDPTNKKYLSIVHHATRIKEQLELHENMTLISCSGTIGKVTMAGRHWENWTASQHIIRIMAANDDIAGYLNVFLASEYGKLLITRYTYGSVVDEIDDNHVRSIAIPLLKNDAVQKKINELALQANELRYQAYCKEQEAIKIMNEDVIFAK